MCVYEIYLLIFKFEFLVTFANRISAVGLVARAIPVISTLYSYNYMLRNRRKTIILLDLMILYGQSYMFIPSTTQDIEQALTKHCVFAIAEESVFPSTTMRPL